MGKNLEYSAADIMGLVDLFGKLQDPPELADAVPIDPLDALRFLIKITLHDRESAGRELKFVRKNLDEIERNGSL